MLVTVNANLIVVAAITGTHVWRESLKQHLRVIFFCFTNSMEVRQLKKRMSISTVSHIKNSDGRQLAFNVRDEQDLYFRQYAWT